MVQGHSCLGCDKSFPTHKRLHALEARCRDYKQLQADLERSQKGVRKIQDDDGDKGSGMHHPEPNVEDINFPNEIPSRVQMFHHETFYIELDENEAGPSGVASASDSHHLSMPQSPEPPPVVSARSGCSIRLPARYTDYLPTGNGLWHVGSLPPLSQSSRQLSPNPPVGDHPPSIPFQTPLNDMHFFQVYLTKPSFLPKNDGDILAVADAPTLQGLEPSWAPDCTATRGLGDSQITHENLYSAFSSPTAGLLMCWQYSGTNEKSGAELNRLWSAFIKDPQFQPSVEAGFNHEREKKRVEKYLHDNSNPFHTDHSWKTSSISILLPHEGSKWPSGEHNPSIPRLPIKDVYHHDITDVIMSTFQDQMSSAFHMMPFAEYWQPDPEADPIRVFGEAYSSPRCLELYQSIDSLPQDPDDDLECVIIPLMLWSDAMQLANFGNASLWPIYLLFGNQSKYTRGKPTAVACHHIAYIPTLPDEFQDEYSQHFQQGSSNDVYTHCKRELMQAIWTLLLDNKFVQAYKVGLVMKFADEIVRRAFPCFFTYGADYPEKILIGCIKFLGTCLCPRCLVEKSNVPQMGTPADMQMRRNNGRVDDQSYRDKISKARKHIFKSGTSINGVRVQNILANESLVPIKNAFSERIADEEFNFFLMFVVDLLHEFECGVWMTIFTHLMRILYAAGGITIQQLNYRYRRVPTFGHGVIWRFHKNASVMKRLAARDFEDLLQCALPVFEGLLPAQHNDIVLDLLFNLATWHAFAKLCLHTDQILKLFDAATEYLGHSTRKFECTTCSYYHTTELPQEHAARGCCTAALAAQQGRTMRATSSGPKVKKLNLQTYKFHALGDYPDMIRLYRTTDSYSTQLGEVEHRRAKRRFLRSGKKKDHMIKSIANQGAIERFI